MELPLHVPAVPASVRRSAWTAIVGETAFTGGEGGAGRRIAASADCSVTELTTVPFGST
jgi:hypothetical protein